MEVRNGCNLLSRLGNDDYQDGGLTRLQRWVKSGRRPPFARRSVSYSKGARASSKLPLEFSVDSLAAPAKPSGLLRVLAAPGAAH